MNEFDPEVDLKHPPTREAVRSMMAMCLRLLERQEDGEDMSEVKERIRESIKSLKPLNY